MPDFNIDRIIEICSQSIIFKNMDKEILKRFLLSSSYRVVFIKKGELIIREEEYVDYMGLVLDGELNICKYSPNGNEILLEKVAVHEVFNLDVISTPTKRSFRTVYATKPSFILKIDFDLEKDIDLSDKDKLIIYRNIINCIGNTNAKQCHKIEIVSQKSIRDKIMNYLLIQKNNKQSNSFNISFDRDQLANYLCVNRSVLSHELSLMQQEGIIKFKKNHFEIVK